MAALFTAAAAFGNFSPRRRRQQTSAIGHELLIKTHFNRTKTIILCLPFKQHIFYFFSVYFFFDSFFFWFFAFYISPFPLIALAAAAAALKLSVRGLTLQLFIAFSFFLSVSPFSL